MIEQFEKPVLDALRHGLGADVAIMLASRDGEFWVKKEKWRSGEAMPLPLLVLMDELDFNCEHAGYSAKDASVPEAKTTIAFEYPVLPFEYDAGAVIFAETADECSTLASRLARYFENNPEIDIPLDGCSAGRPYVTASINLDEVAIATAGPVNAKMLFPVTCVCAQVPRIIDHQAVPYPIREQEHDVAVMSEGRKYEILAAARCCHELANWGCVRRDLQALRYLCGTGEPYATSDRLEQLRTAYLQGEPIDRRMFDTEFESLVAVYPRLYDDTVGGGDPERLVQIISRHALAYENAKHTLCDALYIPGKVEGLQHAAQPRQRLDIYHDALRQPTSTFNAAEYAYDRYAEARLEEERRLSDSFAAVLAPMSDPSDQSVDRASSYQDDEWDDDDDEPRRPSVIGSLVRDVAVTFAGTTPIRRQLKKQNQLLEKLDKSS
ncbi:hypothetical protein [uncultured Adlercreutzia sp.]|uniref:hypothetical protein n=1 Tax=uncultured Adlercreutzia sp. TaxID=875803 RepID=UPI0025CEC1EA|nr:hypothetical protein [uncultured Adlercreutzia sp.]